MIPAPDVYVTALSPIEWCVFLLLITYINGVACLNTSIGLRMGYDMWRIMPVSLIWPVLFIYEPLNEWAKSGECTLPDDHPLRSNQT